MRLRSEKGMAQKELAVASGLSVRAIGGIEKVHWIQRHRLSDLAKGLGVPDRRLLAEPTLPMPTPVLARALFDSLGTTARQMERLTPLPHPQWLTRFDRKSAWLADRIRGATAEVCVICYSLIAWKEQFEDALVPFVRRGGRLRVLMLEPDSPGFVEKAAMESYADLHDGAEADDHFDKWRVAAAALRERHKHDIVNSLHALKQWRDTTGDDRIRCRTYGDTPNWYGFLIDDKSLLVSSYFLNPIERGFRLPALCIDEADDPRTFSFLRLLFRNWFEIKFASGSDPLAAGAER